MCCFFCWVEALQLDEVNIFLGFAFIAVRVLFLVTRGGFQFSLLSLLVDMCLSPSPRRDVFSVSDEAWMVFSLHPAGVDVSVTGPHTASTLQGECTFLEKTSQCALWETFSVCHWIGFATVWFRDYALPSLETLTGLSFSLLVWLSGLIPGAKLASQHWVQTW